jgi:hypothetical protein
MVFSCLALNPVATVFSDLASKPVSTVSPIWPQNWWLEFPGLGLKTSSCGLVIWASKSPRQFLSLVLKTKQALIYQLRHKIDRGGMVWDTHQNLVACFA